MLLSLNQIQAEQDVDHNCPEQDAGIKKQKITASHVDNNKFVIMASLDLPVAFYIVNITLLVK